MLFPTLEGVVIGRTSFHGAPQGALFYDSPYPKWVRNKSGIFELINSESDYVLPFEWDEAGNLLGIRVEPESTNLFLYNRTPETQGIEVTEQPYTLSFIGSGSITLSGAHSDVLNGTGANDRVSLTFTPSEGVLTCTVSGDTDLVQLEAGEVATSPIETSDSPVTRAADVIGVPLISIPSWNGGDGVLAINDEEVEPVEDGTFLYLQPPSGHTHIRTVKWVPSAE